MILNNWTWLCLIDSKLPNKFISYPHSLQDFLWYQKGEKNDAHFSKVKEGKFVISDHIAQIKPTFARLFFLICSWRYYSLYEGWQNCLLMVMSTVLRSPLNSELFPFPEKSKTQHIDKP